MHIFKLIFCLLLMVAVSFPAAARDVLFDVEKRRQELQSPAYAEARQYCKADNVDFDGKLPEPIKGLKTTEGYGSDNRPADFSFYVMVLSGRSLAGDSKATKALKDGLLQWAKAGALTQGDQRHDTYYALKRYMLPVVIGISIIDDQLTSEERKILTKWVDAIVPKLDKKFDGDVDHNNHRYLADSVLMAWGAYKADTELYNIGRKGYLIALRDALPDGSLPLETRRGARATWYMRHALSSLVTIAEIDKAHGGNLYQTEYQGSSLAHIMNYFITASYAPLMIIPHAAQNYIPGPHKDYLIQDTDYMRRRGHDRHYMAFAEAYRYQPTLAAKRLDMLMQEKTEWKHRPYIDEYVGGNATCFYWQPGGTR